MDLLVSTSWLEAAPCAPDLKVIDAAMFPPGNGSGARARYEVLHLPGPVFFDIEGVSGEAGPRPPMLPPEHEFASRKGAA
jgi:thiosulfate/3-mercaptopyruvate sulfurtransferase